MTGTAFSSVSSRSSYWQVSRAPRYSLLFALPLLVFYQVLAVLLAHGERSIRNGADVMLQSLFTAVAGAWGPPLFMVCLIGAGLWLVMLPACSACFRRSRSPEGGDTTWTGGRG